MKISGFESTTRHLVFWLPAFMGVIEYLLRIGLRQPGSEEFFPISLVACGISMNVAATSLPGYLFEAVTEEQREQQLERAIFFMNLGIFASLGGLLLWIYLLMASFSEDVKAIIPLHPLLEASAYYVLSIFLSGRNARVAT